jgi:hypothetical protein
VQHHGVVNSEILDLAFIAFWNQTLQIHVQSNSEDVYMKKIPTFVPFFLHRIVEKMNVML